MKIKSVIQTCSACPSQWEAELTNGHMLYVRYRWEGLSVRISDNPTTDIDDAVSGEEIFQIDVGSGLAGEMTFDELKELTKHLIEW